MTFQEFLRVKGPDALEIQMYLEKEALRTVEILTGRDSDLRHAWFHGEDGLAATTPDYVWLFASAESLTEKFLEARKGLREFLSEEEIKNLRPHEVIKEFWG